MLKMHIVGEEKQELNSVNVSAESNSNFGSHENQIFKGIAGLLGLSVLGGLAYWASGWFGGKGTDTVSAKTNTDSTDSADGAAEIGKASVEVLVENDDGLVVNSPSYPVPASHQRVYIAEEYSLQYEPNAEQIHVAWRSLMSKQHPDKSRDAAADTYAAELNNARDRLKDLGLSTRLE